MTYFCFVFCENFEIVWDFWKVFLFVETNVQISIISRNPKYIQNSLDFKNPR